MKILIVTGSDHYHHRWRDSSAYLRSVLESDGTFEVKVNEEFTGATPATLAGYDAVLLVYFGATRPSEEEARWGTATEQALFDFVKSGRGIVLYHSSFWNGRSWRDEHGDELLRMAGGLLGPDSRRAPELEWPVRVEDPDHPVMRDMPAEWNQVSDDKYVNMRWHPDANPHVLASVYDDPASYLDGAYYAIDANPGPQLYDLEEIDKLPGVSRSHPAVWTNTFGEGRVFALSIGHIGAATLEAAHTMRDTGVRVGPTLDDAARTSAFVNLLRRGTEWAASGRVTLPLV